MTARAWAASPTACRRRRSCRAARATRRTWRSWNRCRCARSSPSPPTARGSPAGTRKLDLRGQAWAGDWDIKTVDISIDAGKTWKSAKVEPARQQVRLAALHRVGRPAELGLLRGPLARDRQQRRHPALHGDQLEPAGLRRQPDQPHPRPRRLLRELTITHVVVITLTATFVLLGLDRAGELRPNQPAYVPPAKPAAVAAPEHDPDKGKPPPHNDKPEDLPDGKGRDVTFYACTACHGVALIKAQGLTRDLWDFDLRPDAGEAPHAAGEAGRARRDPRLSRRAVPAAPSRARRGQSVQIAFAHFSDQTCSGRNSRSSSSPSGVRR